MEQKSFIEAQFPVSKMSKESYKERKAVQSQTLTGLGKWWGRKPLALVRGTLLGLLLPATDNPQRDQEIFLKIMTMDEKGLAKRKVKTIPVKEVMVQLSRNEQERYLDSDASGEPLAKYKSDLSREERQQAEHLAWQRLSYDQKLLYCCRPEDIADEEDDTWQEVNEYLGTNAHNLPELLAELGRKRFGHLPVVGDCFSGGGAVPYEAARLGCEAFASDLNPVAGLLSWADLNIGQATEAELREIKQFQDKVYQAVDRQIAEWGVESNEEDDRGNVYLYCTETVCPECGWTVPMASSWLVGLGSATVAKLVEDPETKSFKIKIESGVSKAEMEAAKKAATVVDNHLVCPHCASAAGNKTAIEDLRVQGKTADGRVIRGLRNWEKDEFVPRPDDVFQERLYCIRYEHFEELPNGKIERTRYYREPTQDDLDREVKVFKILHDNWDEWRNKGYLPSTEIVEGEKTLEPIRTRGWKYWHQLFLPRQLLLLGTILQQIDRLAQTPLQRVIGILMVNRCADWNSKLGRWGVGQARESMAQTFYNQALNTLWEETARGLSLLKGVYELPVDNVRFPYHKHGKTPVRVQLGDARHIQQICDIWITDPPYADAVNYHELTEFFLAWDRKFIEKAFPDWYADSKRILAVRGDGEDFNKSMVDIYRNLAEHMPENGVQVIMFTHQKVAVWAKLALIVWAAGLQVTAAWSITTETPREGYNKGNHIKSTVLLVLRKQRQDGEEVFLDELLPDVEEEVKRQIASMKALEDKEEPNFSDQDYILAAYAAAMKVLTSARRIEDIDAAKELNRVYPAGMTSPIENLILQARKIASAQLVPQHFETFLWKQLSDAERFYIKGIEAEKNDIHQVAVYQELARGFGVAEYTDMLQSAKANAARLRTGKEWGRRNLGSEGFGESLLRHILMALYLSVKNDGKPIDGKTYLRTEVPGYWDSRERIMGLLEYLSTLSAFTNMKHWHQEAMAARVIRELVSTDGV